MAGLCCIRDMKNFTGRCGDSGSLFQGSRFGTPGSSAATPHLPNSPRCRAGLMDEAWGPKVVLHHDDQGQVAGGQGA